MITLRERDPVILSVATVAEMSRCRRCSSDYAEEYAPRTARTCPKCQAVERVNRSEKRFTRLAGRIEAGEDPFGAERGESPKVEQAFVVVEVLHAMVLSHGCDIDNADYVRFAPVRTMTRLGSDDASAVRRRDVGNLHAFYLPSTEGHEEGFVDLDHQFNLWGELLGKRSQYRSHAKGRVENALVPFQEAVQSRVLSLDAAGLRALYSAIVLHLVRPGMYTISADPSDDALLDDPDRPKELPRRGWWWPVRAWPRGQRQKVLDLQPRR